MFFEGDGVSIEVPAGKTTTLGRGTAVHGDLAVSRRQVEVTLDGDSRVRLTVVGPNDSAVVRKGGETTKVPKGESTTLVEGDVLELLSGRHRFTLKKKLDAPSAPPPPQLERKKSAHGDEVSGLAAYAALVKATSHAVLAEGAAPAAVVAVIAAPADDKEAQLRVVFPGIAASALKEALRATAGDVDLAAARLLAGGTQATASPASAPAPSAAPVAAAAAAAAPRTTISEAVKRLSVMFPEVELSLLEFALGEASGDVAAASLWLTGAAPDKPPGAAAATPKSSSPARKEPEKKVPVREITSSGRRLFIKIDRDRPCQSLRALKGDPVTTYFVPAASGFKDDAQYCLWNFQTMIEREQELYDTHICFYHSYSYAHLLYEVQAELARAVYGLPDDFAPLPRILQAPYNGLPLIDMLLDDFKKLGSDHNPKYRALAISVSVSLFAPSSEAPPTRCFQGGYSCMDLSFRGLLSGVLEGCRAPKDIIEDIADAIVALGEKYKLGAWAYSKPSKRAIHGYAMPPAGDRMVAAPGMMLQLFVHKDYVDTCAYSAHAGGTPTNLGPLSKLLTHGLADGQARVLCNPLLWTDRSKTRLFFYAANPTLALMDDTVPGSRGAFIKELRRILSPIIGDPVALRKTFKGIQDLPSSSSQH